MNRIECRERIAGLALLGHADKSTPDGSCSCLRPVVGAQFYKAAGNVISGRLVTDEETQRDLFVGQSHRHECEHFKFALAQLLPRDGLKQALCDVGRDAAFVLMDHLDCLNDLLLRSAVL